MTTSTLHVSKSLVPTSDDESEILSVIQSLYQAHLDKSAENIAAPFAADAAVYDLEPPLMHHGISVERKRKWLASWDTPIELEPSDLTIKVSGDLAVVHGFVRMSGKKKEGDRPVSFWMRSTLCLERGAEGWRITHEHTSVPFYMDASLRPAFDLHP